MDCGSCGRRTAPARGSAAAAAGRSPRAARRAAPRPSPARGSATRAATPLASRAPPTDAVARKVVTIVFADLSARRRCTSASTPESARRFMDRYYRGDARRGRGARRHRRRSSSATASWRVSACRAWPRTTRIRAVRAAVAMQRAFRELAPRAARRGRQAGLRGRRQHRRGRRRATNADGHRRSRQRRGAPPAGGARRRRR